MDRTEEEYTFTARVWCSEWYFASLPADLAAEIRAKRQLYEEGWGRLKARAKIGGSEWKTAIWFDTKAGTYLLPIKKEIRTRERVGAGIEVAVTLWV